MSPASGRSRGGWDSYQRQLMYGVLGLWVVLCVPFVIRHLSNVFGS